MIRCALPMTLTKSIAFQTPTGVHDEYNVTEYTFDELVCNFTGFVRTPYIETTETYMCRTGNILHTVSQIFNDGHLNMDIGRIMCRLDEIQKKVIPQSYLTFACKDTGKVKPRIGHNNKTQYTVIKPVSFYQSGRLDLKEWHELIYTKAEFSVWFQGDYGFEYFVCYWRTCSSLIIIATESAESLDHNEREKYLNKLLEGILERPAIVPSNLEITETNVTVLAEVICRYEILQRLAVVNNQLQEIPMCLHKMKMLKFLDVSFNAIRSINEITFGSRQHPIYLDLSFNQIAYIKQDAFSKLTALVFLSLRNNSLTGINFHLPTRYVMQLDISYNKIKSLPSTISKLARIQTLLLQHNKIQMINFKIPPSLAFLDLSNNHIEFIDKGVFENAANLQSLNLRNNKLKMFELSWEHVPNIGSSSMEFIDLKNNLIENLDKSLFTRTPKLLDLSYNKLKSIDLEILQKAKYLQTLRLDHNNITEIRDDILNGTKEITILPDMNYMNLSHNQLKVAPLSLIFLNMHVIDFSYNVIERCTWSNMSNVYILKNIDQKVLGSCIKKYDHKKEPLGNLILLEHNQIKSLKDVFGRISVMVYRYASLLCHVHLPNNPFHCDCTMFPYLRALQDFTTQVAQNEADDTQNIIISKESALQMFSWNTDQHPCDTPKAMKSYSLLDKTLVDQLTCSLLPQEECQFLYKPSAQLLLVNCSNLKMKNIPLFDASLAVVLNNSATEHHIQEGLKVNIYLNGNNFNKISLNHPEKIAITEFVEQSIKGEINVLDLSHSNIVDIGTEFLIYLSEKLPNLTHLYLNDNNITKLPLNNHINSLNSGTGVLFWRKLDKTALFWEKLTELHLYNNTWDCSCDALWMKQWLNELIARKILVRPDEVKCATPEWNRGKMVYAVDDTSSCNDPKSIHGGKTSFFAISSIVITMTAATLVLWCSWKFMRIKNIKVPPSRDAIVDDNDIIGMEFDAFVSYCEADSDWVEQELIPQLQQHDPQYKVCQHKRHFVPGMSSQWNEFNAIRHSRRTIVVMSNEYLDREHCMYEFTAAYSYWIRTKKNPRLVVVKYPDLESENQNETCSAYFRHFTYLAKDENTFDRLFAFMPREGLAQNVIVNNTGNTLFMRDEAFVLRQDGGQTDTIEDPYEEELCTEDEKYEQMWQEAELEAAERIEAGEDVLAEEIFVKKLDSIMKHSTTEGQNMP
jgi:Leucine-rich repeat (LRR) protein